MSSGDIEQVKVRVRARLKNKGCVEPTPADQAAGIGLIFPIADMLVEELYGGGGACGCGTKRPAQNVMYMSPDQYIIAEQGIMGIPEE